MLRHTAVDWNVPIDSQGYVELGALTEFINEKYRGNYMVSDFFDMSATCASQERGKHRFQFACLEGGAKVPAYVRCVHGHKLSCVDPALIYESIETDPSLVPEYAYHGTKER